MIAVSCSHGHTQSKILNKKSFEYKQNFDIWFYNFLSLKIKRSQYKEQMTVIWSMNRYLDVRWLEIQNVVKAINPLEQVVLISEVKKITIQGRNDSIMISESICLSMMEIQKWWRQSCSVSIRNDFMWQRWRLNVCLSVSLPLCFNLFKVACHSQIPVFFSYGICYIKLDLMRCRRRSFSARPEDLLMM